MKRLLLLTFIIVAFYSCGQQQKRNSPIYNSTGDSLLTLSNATATLSISRFGGALTGFYFNDQKMNPLSWRLTSSEMPENNKYGAPFQGHFLCTGRWGSPTEKEIAAGIPHNGEPSNKWWNVDASSSKLSLKMNVDAPLERLRVERVLKFSSSMPCFIVEEKLENLNSTRRNIALVQHATFGTPFLTNHTIISSNATFGFNQSLVKYSFILYEYIWPNGFSDTSKTPLNLNKSESKASYVSTHIIEDEFGWATAATPSSKLLVGYLWKSADYPWLHIWHGIRNGNLWAKALEFGTTGLGDTYSPEEREKITFHGKSNNQFVEAGGKISKKYFCFLIKIPEGYTETKSVVYKNNIVKVSYIADGKEYSEIFKIKVWQ